MPIIKNKLSAMPLWHRAVSSLHSELSFKTAHRIGKRPIMEGLISLCTSWAFLGRHMM